MEYVDEREFEIGEWETVKKNKKQKVRKKADGKPTIVAGAPKKNSKPGVPVGVRNRSNNTNPKPAARRPSTDEINKWKTTKTTRNGKTGAQQPLPAKKPTKQKTAAGNKVDKLKEINDKTPTTETLQGKVLPSSTRCDGSVRNAPPQGHVPDRFAESSQVCEGTLLNGSLDQMQEYQEDEQPQPLMTQIVYPPLYHGYDATGQYLTADILRAVALNAIFSNEQFFDPSWNGIAVGGAPYPPMPSDQLYNGVTHMDAVNINSGFDTRVFQHTPSESHSPILHGVIQRPYNEQGSSNIDDIKEPDHPAEIAGTMKHLDPHDYHSITPDGYLHERAEERIENDRSEDSPESSHENIQVKRIRPNVIDNESECNKKRMCSEISEQGTNDAEKIITLKGDVQDATNIKTSLYKSPQNGGNTAPLSAEPELSILQNSMGLVFTRPAIPVRIASPNKNNNCQEEDQVKSSGSAAPLETKKSQDGQNGQVVKDTMRNVSHPKKNQKVTQKIGDSAKYNGAFQADIESSRDKESEALDTAVCDVSTHDSHTMEDDDETGTTEIDGERNGTANADVIDPHDKEVTIEDGSNKIINKGKNQENVEKNQKKKKKKTQNGSQVKTVVTYGDVITYVLNELEKIYSGQGSESFYPVTKVPDNPLPKELARHVAELCDLSYNYDPYILREKEQWQDGRRHDDTFGSLEDDSEYSDGSPEDRGVLNETDGFFLQQYRAKLRLFAKLSHLMEIASKPEFQPMLKEWMSNAPDISHSDDDAVSGEAKASASLSISTDTNQAELFSAIKGERSHRDKRTENMNDQKSFLVRSVYDTDDISKLNFMLQELSLESVDEKGNNPTNLENTSREESRCSKSLSTFACLNNCHKTSPSSTRENGDTLNDSFTVFRSGSTNVSQYSCRSGVCALEDSQAEEFAGSNVIKEYMVLLQDLLGTSRSATGIDDLRRVLWAQLGEIKADLERQFIHVEGASKGARPFRTKDPSSIWQGGDVKRTLAKDANRGRPLAATEIELPIDDDDLMEKGWLDRSLVDQLTNDRGSECVPPVVEGPSKTPRKFKGLKFWWLP